MMLKLVAASCLTAAAAIGAIALTVAPGQAPSGPSLITQPTAATTTTSSAPTATGRPGY